MRYQACIAILIAVLALTACAGHQPVQVGVSQHPQISDSIRTVLEISQEKIDQQDDQVAQLLEQKPELTVLAENARRNSKDLKSRHALAEAYMSEKLLASAFSLYQEILVVSPNDTEAELGLAKIWDEWGDYMQAREHAERAINGQIGNPETFELLGRICLHQNDTESALRAFSAALKIAPESSSILANAGYAYLLLSEWDEARDHLERALKLDKAITEAHNHLGIVYAHQGKREAAMLEFLAVNTLAASLNNIGVVYLAENRLKEARAEFLNALAIDPGYEMAMANLWTVESLLLAPEEILTKPISKAIATEEVQSSGLNTENVNEVSEAAYLIFRDDGEFRFVIL